MKYVKERLSSVGIILPEIMIPKKCYDLHKWAVVACDQYTSQKEYWGKVNDVVGDNPSTLHLTLPEVYLDTPQEGDMIKKINS